MHPDVERLTRIVPPPERPVAVDLGTFEREAGAGLPSNLADLMRAYGPGVFDELVVAFAPDPGGLLPSTRFDPLATPHGR